MKEIKIIKGDEKKRLMIETKCTHNACSWNSSNPREDPECELFQLQATLLVMKGYVRMSVVVLRGIVDCNERQENTHCYIQMQS